MTLDSSVAETGTTIRACPSRGGLLRRLERRPRRDYSASRSRTSAVLIAVIGLALLGVAGLPPDTGAEPAMIVAERLRKVITSYPFHPWMTGGKPVMVSIGVATAPLDAVDLQTLIQMADEGLYAAKRLGRNQVWAGRDVPPGANSSS